MYCKIRLVWIWIVWVALSAREIIVKALLQCENMGLNWKWWWINRCWYNTMSGWSCNPHDTTNCKMLNHIPKPILFSDYLHFGVVFDFFLLLICRNLCNLKFVSCLSMLNLPNLSKLRIHLGLNHGTKVFDHWATYPMIVGNHRLPQEFSFILYQLAKIIYRINV